MSISELSRDPDPALESILAFIADIGIEVEYRQLNEETVLPGIDIKLGRLVIDSSRLKHPGDLLHEAGHIAVVPAAERAALSSENIGARKDQAAEEMMAIAWSYAAALHIGIHPYVVFHEHGYHGGGKEIADNFIEGRYFGVPMLEYTGMSEREELNNTYRSLFPRMSRWTRE